MSENSNPFTESDLMLAQAVAEVLAGSNLGDTARRHGFKASVLKKAFDANTGAIRPVPAWDLKQLGAAQFDPIKWTIEGILPCGLCLVVAAPKTGKTRLVVQLGIAVAAGTDALGLTTTRSSVLMLSLEDGYRRLRAMAISHPDFGLIADGQFTVAITAPRLKNGDENGLVAHLRRWLQRRTGPTFLVIDVLQRVRPGRRLGAGAYESDYGDLEELQSLAVQFGTTIALVHHTNQLRDAADPFDRVSGSSGLIGVVDTLLLLERQRGDVVGKLTVAGRDVIDTSLALGFDRGWWTPTNMPGEIVDLSPDMRRLWLWLNDNEGATTKDAVAGYGGRSEPATYKALCRLEESDLVDRLEGHERARKDVPVRWMTVPALTNPGLQGLQ